jgi:hypothetical protein
MSTPAGRFSLVRFSIVLLPGSTNVDQPFVGTNFKLFAAVFVDEGRPHDRIFFDAWSAAGQGPQLVLSNT